jgi:hypothetical protein
LTITCGNKALILVLVTDQYPFVFKVEVESVKATTPKAQSLFSEGSTKVDLPLESPEVLRFKYITDFLKAFQSRKLVSIKAQTEEATEIYEDIAELQLKTTSLTLDDSVRPLSKALA